MNKVKEKKRNIEMKSTLWEVPIYAVKVGPPGHMFKNEETPGDAFPFNYTSNSIKIPSGIPVQGWDYKDFYFNSLWDINQTVQEIDKQIANSVLDLMHGFSTSMITLQYLPMESMFEKYSHPYSSMPPTAQFLYGEYYSYVAKYCRHLFFCLETGKGPDITLDDMAQSETYDSPHKKVWNFTVQVSFIECLQEEFFDLLLLSPEDETMHLLMGQDRECNPAMEKSSSFNRSFNQKKKKEMRLPSLKLRNSTETGPFIEGAQTLVISSPEDLFELISGGIFKRHSKKSKINPFSNSVLKLSLRQTSLDTDQYINSSVSFIECGIHDKVANPGEWTISSSVQKFKKLQSAGVAMRRLLAQVQSSAHRDTAPDVLVSSICKDSPFTQFISESFVGNVKAHILGVIDGCCLGPEATPAPALVAANAQLLRQIARKNDTACRAKSTLRRKVSVGVGKTDIAAVNIKSEIERLKLALKNNAASEGDQSSRNAEQEQLQLELANQENQLQMLTEELVVKEKEVKESLKVMRDKQKIALKRISDALKKKEEISMERDKIDNMVKEVMTVEQSIKEKLHADETKISMVAQKLDITSKEIEEQKNQLHMKGELLRNIKQTKEDTLKQTAASIFQAVIHKERIAREEPVVKLQCEELRMKKKHLISQEETLHVDISNLEALNKTFTVKEAELKEESCVLDEKLSLLTKDKTLIELRSYCKDLEQKVKELENTLYENQVLYEKELAQYQDYKLRTETEKKELSEKNAKMTKEWEELVNDNNALQVNLQKNNNKIIEMENQSKLLKNFEGQELNIYNEQKKTLQLLNSQVEDYEKAISTGKGQIEAVLVDIKQGEVSISLIRERTEDLMKKHESLCHTTAEKIMPF